ncbi:MAG TPA: MliC family protein [Acidobacteriota bacterium]|nr:MliC family protein [Acidobacteriota bacterium]
MKLINKVILLPLFVLAIFIFSTMLNADDANSKPSFDCSKATGQIEQLICKDETLAKLDRKMAQVFEDAMKKWPADEANKQKIIQRGWIKGRNDCWKADDLRACVQNEYNTRIVVIQIQSGQLMVPTPIGYECEGNESKQFTVVFYNDTDPKSAVLTFGDDQVIAFSTPAASGAKYSAQNMEFWEHHGEATVDWYGTKMKCKSIPSTGNE